MRLCRSLSSWRRRQRRQHRRSLVVAFQHLHDAAAAQDRAILATDGLVYLLLLETRIDVSFTRFSALLLLLPPSSRHGRRRHQRRSPVVSAALRRNIF